MQDQLVRDPIYQQLNQVLRGLIRDGSFEAGAQFLTEREISERFDVSRATANKALSNLVSEGVLEFRKGVGTFVRGGVLDYDLRSLVSFTDKAKAAGKKPSTRVLRFETARGADLATDVLDGLDAAADDELYYLERLRLADRTPMIFERRYVVARYCPGLTKTACKGSLYALWAEKYELDIAGADETIRAVCIDEADAEALRVKPGSAGLLVQAVGRLANGAALWWERTLYRGDAYEFRNRLGPLQTARPAAGVFVDASETRE